MQLLLLQHSYYSFCSAVNLEAADGKVRNSVGLEDGHISGHSAGRALNGVPRAISLVGEGAALFPSSHNFGTLVGSLGIEGVHSVDLDLVHGLSAALELSDDSVTMDALVVGLNAALVAVAVGVPSSEDVSVGLVGHFVGVSLLLSSLDTGELDEIVSVSSDGGGSHKGSEELHLYSVLIDY